MKLKDDYHIASCCRPEPGDTITGYYSHNRLIKVHRHDCPSLAKAPADRLVSLSWDDIIADAEFFPDADYFLLDDVDFAILRHHHEMGIDYSLAVAAGLHLDKTLVFDRHEMLRTRGILTRVVPTMVRYRKNIVPGKWIKQRNHTYYRLTDKGNDYLTYYLSHGSRETGHGK